MSLFKAREWWGTHVGEEEEFDLGCICVGNIDNSTTVSDKIIVGSYHGVLRIYNPRPEKTDNGWSGFNPRDVMCETHLSQPILQVEVGHFISTHKEQTSKPVSTPMYRPLQQFPTPFQQHMMLQQRIAQQQQQKNNDNGSDGLHIAVLHSRKLALYSLVVMSGAVDHGTQYQLKLVHEHNLQRTAYNFCYGPFGGVKGKDFICIQSMDGTVSVYEQESFAFTRFLPGALLPGPIRYVAKTDSFVTVSSSRQVESYKYQVLAVASDAKTKEESQNVKAGKRVASEWTFNIGEQAVDIAVVSFDNAPLSIYVLGERNIYILTETGKLRHMKKFEFNPSCFLPYASVEKDCINCMVATHTNTLMIYKDVTLQWAAQLPMVPVQLRVGNFIDLKGAILTLTDAGHLTCWYLGTDPAMFTTPTAEVREIDYAELDYEMKQLQKVIREQQHKSSITLPAAKTEDEIQIVVEIPPDLDEQSQAIDVEYEEEDTIPSITAKVCVKAKTHVTDVRVSLHIPIPVFANESLVSFSALDPSQPAEWHVSFFKRFRGLLCTLSGEVIATYTSSGGAPRVVHAPLRLPLKLVTKAAPPNKTATYKVTIDTNKPPVSLNDVYPDLLGENEGGPGNALGFRYYGTQDVITVLASKTSQRYRLQCDRFENIWMLLDDTARRLSGHMLSHGQRDFKVSYDGQLPLTEYFEVLDNHFNLRQEESQLKQMLEERAGQFRAIQRRLLTRFKDKTPAPLANLDTLLNGTYTQLMHIGDEMERNRVEQQQSSVNLGAATRLLIYLIRLWQNLNDSEYAILEATLTPEVADNGQQGWEEMVDASITHLLRTCLAKSAKDQTVNPSPLALLKDTQKLKKHIALLCDRLSKGAKLVVEGAQPVLEKKEPGSIPASNKPKKSSSTGKVPDLSDYSRQSSRDSIASNNSSILGDGTVPIGSKFGEKKASPRGKNNELPALNGGGGALPPLAGGNKFMKSGSAIDSVPDLDSLESDSGQLNGSSAGELVYGADEL